MKCKHCKIKFEQKYFLQKYCLQSDECIKEFSIFAKEQKEKATAKEWKKEKKVIKESLLTKKDYLNILQKVFNTYIRMRDKGLNCISCDKPIKQGNCDAGHMWSAGLHTNVRFNEYNVNAQCSRPCNKDLSGDINNYRIGFIKKYGEEKLKEIDSIAKTQKIFTIDELKELIKYYKSLIKTYK